MGITDKRIINPAPRYNTLPVPPAYTTLPIPDYNGTLESLPDTFTDPEYVINYNNSIDNNTMDNDVIPHYDDNTKLPSLPDTFTIPEYTTNYDHIIENINMQIK